MQADMLDSPSRIRLNGELLSRKFTVRVGEVRAAMLFASTDETRFVLNGVKIEVHPGKQPLLIATDGRRLAAIETVADQGTFGESDVDFEIILSTQFLKPLTAFAKSQSSEMAFEFHPSDRIIANFVGGKCFVDCEQGAVIQGTYPNWRQCVPTGRKQMVPHIGVNAEFIGDFAKAAKFMDVETPIISVNLIGKTDAMDIRIEARPNFYGVLMPAKVDDDREWQPEFLEVIGYAPPIPESDENEAAN